jgi:hypothetical protein
MGADKNSSRRMNSAYAPNSQPRVDTRVCQGHVVITDLQTLGTNPNSKQHGSATQEAKDLGNRRSPRRTIRGDWVDSPRGMGGRSAGQGRTVRKRTPNLQQRTLKMDSLGEQREQSKPRGLSGHPGELSEQLLPTKNLRHDRSK